jgi:hypothetical protein
MKTIKGPLNLLNEYRFEKIFGRTAYAHLFVTKAMKNHLVKEWDLQCVVIISFEAMN